MKSLPQLYWYYYTLTKIEPQIFKWKISNDNEAEVEQGFATLFTENGESVVSFGFSPNEVRTICKRHNLIYSLNLITLNPICNLNNINYE